MTSVTVILFEQTFPPNFAFLYTGVFVIRPENVTLSDDHDKTRK